MTVPEAARYGRAMVDTEAELVAAIATGDRQALGLVYDRYAPVLMAVGMRILGEVRDAEDVVHEVFVEAWKHAATYDPVRGTVRAWLVTRMRSRSLDRAKSAARTRSVALDDAPEPVARPDLRRDDHRRLHEALGALPEEQRQVLELGYFDGLSSSEIAWMLDVPVGTVKSRVAAGLQKLRGAFR